MLDFIDVGSSKGGSVEYCMAKFGNNGYGIDIDERKVKVAKGAGLDVRHMSIFDVQDRAKWCTALHVIEHLPSGRDAKAVIDKMLHIGKQLYITLPYFDADGYLYRNGLKLFWSDWPGGHTYQPSTLELHNIFRDLGVEYKMELHKPILHSNEPELLPLDAPPGQLGYDKSMGKKREMKLTDVYREVRITI